MKPLACLTIAMSALAASNAFADTYRLNVIGVVETSIETNDINRYAGDTMSASITFDAPTAGVIYLSPIPIDVKFFANGVYHGNLQSGGYNISSLNTTNANGSFSLSASSFINSSSLIADTLTLSGAGKADANPVTVGLANISSWSFVAGRFVGVRGDSASGSITSYVLTDLTSGLVVSAAPVPEPATYAMLLAGICLLSAVTRRRRPRLQDGSNAPRSN